MGKEPFLNGMINTDSGLIYDKWARIQVLALLTPPGHNDRLFAPAGRE